MTRMLLPLGIFAALVVLLVAGLQTADQRQIVQSPLIGKPVPEFALPSLHDAQTTIAREDLVGRPFVINVWGSWCPSCRVEHPLITRMGREIEAPLVGLNWKDERSDALRWLSQFGDAWDFHIFDNPGGFGIDLGVYGAPETFLVDHTGTIRHKHTGPVTPESYDDLVARIRRLDKEAES